MATSETTASVTHIADVQQRADTRNLTIDKVGWQLVGWSLLTNLLSWSMHGQRRQAIQLPTNLVD